VRSESVTDLNSELLNGPGAREARCRSSAASGYGKVSGDADHIPASSKPFGLGEYISNMFSFLYISRHIITVYCSFFLIMVFRIHPLESFQVVANDYNC
jgi:hypothetical protein